MTDEPPRTPARVLAEGFGIATDDYAQGRPSYSADAVAPMLDGLSAPADVVDVGAGSGQLALPLASAGARVVAVEPLEGPRRILASLAGDRVTVMAGRAEALDLPAESADLVTCGDAFHWFDAPVALTEFRRVLRPDGRLCIARMRWGFSAAPSYPWRNPAGSLFRRRRASAQT